MFKFTPRLLRLMSYYNIANLGHGAKEDKLGDVYEDYIVELFSDPILLEKAKSCELNIYNTDEYIYNKIISRDIFPYAKKIYNMSATRNIQPRITGGNPKTDVIVDVEIDDGIIQIPISIKQTTAPKVAMAEFDVDTIVNEIGITDQILIKYLEKHQRDASARYFTAEEKQDLTRRLQPYAFNFVRWVVSGTPQPTSDLRFPELLVKFLLNRNDDITNFNCFTIDEYVKTLMYDRFGNPKKGGFGTGLGWTYATGSKGKKIQFKG